MARRNREQTGGVSINLTPMIDCTFMLIIFFILATTFASAALAPVELHQPHESQAISSKDMEVPNRIIINVTSTATRGDSSHAAAAGADAYVIMGERIELHSTDLLQDRIEEFRANARQAGFQRDEFWVEIRADRRVSFMHVEPVMKAAARAGVATMNITARVN